MSGRPKEKGARIAAGMDPRDYPTEMRMPRPVTPPQRNQTTQAPAKAVSPTVTFHTYIHSGSDAPLGFVTKPHFHLVPDSGKPISGIEYRAIPVGPKKSKPQSQRRRRNLLSVFLGWV